LILSGYRQHEECYPRCPWEEITPLSYLLYNLFAGSCTAHTDPQSHNTSYEFDPVRFRLAMDIHGVPADEWALAYQFIGVCLEVLK